MKVKSLRYSIVLTAIILATIGIACIDIPPSGVIIYAFDQNPAGSDDWKGLPFTIHLMKARR